MSRRASVLFLRPTSPDDAVAALAEHADDAKVIAGGQSLGPMLTYHLISPAVLVDLTQLDELRGIKVVDDTAFIGATTTQATIAASTVLRDVCPLLVEATAWVAHPAVRERGTIGGSVAHNDPAGEYPSVLIALDAVLHVLSTRGARSLDASSIVGGRILDTSLEPDEIITGISIPVRHLRTGHAFHEVAGRHGDYATAGAAVAVTLSDGGERVEGLRLTAIGGLYPLRLDAGEQVLVGRQPTRAALLEAAAAAAEQAPLGDDLHASAAYRRRLFSTLAARGLHDAVEAARA